VSCLKSNVTALRRLATAQRILRELIENKKHYNVSYNLECRLREALRLLEEVYDIVSYCES
jgi:rRNA processing protein Krr1/Pno1